jgi:hypothetical protein
MTGRATALSSETAARAEENMKYVRGRLKARQPQFAAALESAVEGLLRDRGAACAAGK